MKKTTVYLPEDLKEELAALALAEGRSEAQLIRDALRRAVDGKRSPRPIIPLFTSDDPGLAENVDEALAGFGSD
jgi:plasmid stability protein